MKKILALSVAAVICLSVVAFAGHDKGDHKQGGTITKLNVDGKVMTVKDKDGKEWEINWNDSTKVEGSELKEGEIVHFKATEKDGKFWATWVHVGEIKELKKKY